MVHPSGRQMWLVGTTHPSRGSKGTGSMGKSQRQPARNTGNNREHGGTFATPSGIPEDQCTFSKDQTFNVLRAIPGLTSDFHEHLQRRRKGEHSRMWAMAVTCCQPSRPGDMGDHATMDTAVSRSAVGASEPAPGATMLSRAKHLQ